MYFATLSGLYLLLFLIGLVIIYLIKAKPKDITIPSLLFFSNDRKTKKYNSFLKKLLVKALFFLQMLFIILLALSAANPFIEVPMDAYSLNTVVVVDVSASMNTKDTSMTSIMTSTKRIGAGKQELLRLVNGKVSIILAEENPVVIARNVSSSRARALITNIEAKDIPTRIDSSILLANELMGNEKGSIVVYSDFILNKDDDILAAKKVAEANDKRVIFLNNGKKQENLGFVVLNINSGKGEAFVKNFGDRKKVIDIRFNSGDKKEQTRIDIAPYSLERINFDVKKGDTVLELSQHDSLQVDDELYIVNPYEAKTDILFITNNLKVNPILDALEANQQFNVMVTRPPVIPDLASFDVVIIGEVDRTQLLPNSFRDIRKYKESGGKVILTLQGEMDKFDLDELVNFKIGKRVNKVTDVCIDVVNDFTAGLSSTRCFTSTTMYYDVNTNEKTENDINENNTDKSNTNKDKSFVIASNTNDMPMFILENNLFYYGIMDSLSGFKEQINYPLFWDDVINYMLGRENLANFNFKTGDILLSGGNESDKVILDRAGIFDIAGRRVAVNLLNDAESDIFRESLVLNNTAFDAEYEKVRLSVNIDHYLLMLAVLLFGYELYYIKKRGNL